MASDRVIQVTHMLLFAPFLFYVGYIRSRSYWESL